MAALVCKAANLLSKAAKLRPLLLELAAELSHSAIALPKRIGDRSAMISTAYAVLSLVPGRATPRTSLGAPRSAVLSMQEVAYVSPTGKALESAEIMTECLLLPKEAYPGSPPVSIVGEVMLQELRTTRRRAPSSSSRATARSATARPTARRRRASAASGSAARSSSR